MLINRRLPARPEQCECLRTKRQTALCAASSVSRRHRSQVGIRPGKNNPLFIAVEPDGSDSWRLDPVVDLLKGGAVGILPTDTYPALVCDIDSRAAIERLYRAKGMEPSKPLSMLCRNFQDIDAFTLGFPAQSAPGRLDPFRAAKRALPGPYTLILHASKRLPKQCVDFLSGKAKPRRTVGVRLPDNPVIQAVLRQLERPLLCSSVYMDTPEFREVPEAALIMDMFSAQDLDFVVDAGPKVTDGSTIIDMTAVEPTLIRQGQGDASAFVADFVPA